MCSQLTDTTSCFTASVETTDRETILRVGGELDMTAASLLCDVVLEACSGTKRVVIEASDVTFVDAAGLRALLGHYRPDVLDRVQVRNASLPLFRLLDLLGMLYVVEERHR